MYQQKFLFNKHPEILVVSGDLQQDSVVDGPGLRTVIWTQGCIHNCKDCHNPETHAFDGGKYKLINEIIEEIKLIGQNVTFSGGDPFLQPMQCAIIAKYCKKNGLNVWAYTGFTFEQLVELDNQDINEFLKCIDVLVDGKFDISKKSLECKYRGSSNQRIIDVQATLKNKQVVLWKDPYEEV
jgi:anaerobic ribonucleoside-triphosphate reductase activating protein